MTVDLTALRRNEKGLSIRQAAAQIGIDRRTLASAERGLGVHPGTAKLIADYYGLKVTDIWPVERMAAA